jgi:hypothetical protein
MDSIGEEDAKLEKQINSVIWFIEHPDSLEAIKDDVLKTYIKHLKKRVEEEEQRKQMLLASSLEG